MNKIFYLKCVRVRDMSHKGVYFLGLSYGV